MTESQFHEWLHYHRSRFSGLNEWFKKKPVTASGDDFNITTRADTIKGWFKTLEPCDFAAAKRSSDRMHNGDLDEPVGYDRHPKAIVQDIKAFSREAASTSYHHRQFIGKEAVSNCPLCRDSDMATVQIWWKISVKAALDGTLGQPGTAKNTMVCCSCDRGKERARADNLIVYDPKRHVLFEYGEDSKEELRKFMATRNPPDDDPFAEPNESDAEPSGVLDVLDSPTDWGEI